MQKTTFSLLIALVFFGLFQMPAVGGMMTNYPYNGDNVGKLPDTGQTTSYTDTYGEDSDYHINPPCYTKLDSSGNQLPDTAASWAMVRDNVTGLIWEVKSTDGSIHDMNSTLSWRDAENNFIGSLNTNRFGGYSDWRLPTNKELAGIVNHEVYDPSIDRNFFPNTQSGQFWTSTTHANGPSPGTDYYAVWLVDFYDGRAGEWSMEVKKKYVRAVSGARFENSFVDNGDLTVTDKSTGLMWSSITAGPMSWEGAIAYCEDLPLFKYDDWRLPNIKELRSLVDYSKQNLAIDIGYFPFTYKDGYWSSTTYVFYPESAYGVDFESGFKLIHYGKSQDYYVRAVR